MSSLVTPVAMHSPWIQMTRTNANWPEGFGFRIGGNAPVIVTDIFENSYAQKSGLRPGDQLLEVDGVNVQGVSKENVIALARQSKHVPPALCVISRIRTFTLRRRRGTFGFKVRGGGPVLVSYLEEGGPAKVAGIGLGDMLIELNHTSVREMTYVDVERMIQTSGSVLHLVLIAGVKSIAEIEKRNTASRFQRAREFFHQMNYYLAGEEKKKSQLVKELNRFAKDKSVETLAQGIKLILETPVQKRLIPSIRQLIPRDQRNIFREILQDDHGTPSIARSASFEGNLSRFTENKFPDRRALKFRSFSKGNLLPAKTTSSTLPRGYTPAHRRSNTTPSTILSRSSSESTPFSGTNRWVQNLAETLKFQMNKYLTRGEQLVLKQRLKEYQKHRDISLLVTSLEPILDEREKLQVVPYLSEILPENVKSAFDKEARKLMLKYVQDLSSEGPDVIDVAYRVQGLRLADSPHSKNLIGGSARDDLEMYPMPDRPNSPRTNETSTVAALLTAAENTNVPIIPGKTITVEALIHSEKKEPFIGRLNNRHDSLSSPGPMNTGLLNLTENTDEPMVDIKPIVVSSGDTNLPQPSEEKGEIRPHVIHKDLDSAVEEKKKQLARKEQNVVPTPPVPPSSGLVPIAPPPPPPPPPPPGLSPQGNNTLPKMQLKRVNWEKLGVAGLENTVWGQLGRNDPLNELEDFLELEQQFSSAKQSKVPLKSTKQEKIEILDPRKQYNIAILLAHLKLPHDEIRRAVLSMDETKLSEAHVKQLLLYAPDHKEIHKYKSFGDDETKLSQSDKFSIMVSKIPGYRHRLKAMVFKSHFSDKLEEIKPELDCVILASRELRESKKLQQVLQLVLAFGNHMNQGNARIAGASAFRVGYLSKLSSTKTSDNKSNLLKFLVKTVDTKCPHVLDLKNELASIPLAARVSYQMVKEEIDDVTKSMMDVKKDLEEHGSQIPDNNEDKFAKIMGSFVENSKTSMANLTSLHDQMLAEYTKTAKYFGEDPMMTSTEEFFGTFSTFLDQFEGARLEILTHRKHKEEQSKRENEKQNRLKKKRGKKSLGSSEETNENKEANLTSKQKDDFVKTKVLTPTGYQSSSSESDVPVSPMLALSYEMKNKVLFKSNERLQQSPPPIPPKPRGKPKLPTPTNRNAGMFTPTNKNEEPSSASLKNSTWPDQRTINNQAMQEITNEIKQQNNVKFAQFQKSTTVDNTDGEEKKARRVPKKPIALKKAKSVDFTEIELFEPSEKHQNTSTQKRKNAEKTNGKKESTIFFSNGIYEEANIGRSNIPKNSEIDFQVPSPRTSIKPNFEERKANTLSYRKQLSLGCEREDNTFDEDPLYSTVNFTSLGYTNNVHVDTDKDVGGVYSPTSYSPPKSAPSADATSIIKIPPELGIKEIMSIVKEGSSYTVGDNNDVYRIPVKSTSSSASTVAPTVLETPPSTDMFSPSSGFPQKKNWKITVPEEIYSKPEPRRVPNSDSEKSDSDAAIEGPYASTTLFRITKTPKSSGDVSRTFSPKTSPTFDASPPNFKPPPPPVCGSPLLKKYNKKRLSPPLPVRHPIGSKSPKVIQLKHAEISNDQIMRSKSVPDLANEAIFASPSSLGINVENNNNDRYSMLVTPEEFGQFSECFVQSDITNNTNNLLRDNDDPTVGNGRKPVTNDSCNITTSASTIGKKAPLPSPSKYVNNGLPLMVPPHPKYPPPRLFSSERSASPTPSDNTEWRETVASLPPPPQEFFET